MKLSTIFLSGLFVVTRLVSSEGNHGIYYNELKALKKAKATQMMFNEDSHSGLAKIQRDIINYQQLSSFQKLVNQVFLDLDVVVVTPDTLPNLYTYVERICKKAKIKTPTIFVTRHKTFFNASAQKILASAGGICIGQKLIRDCSDDALESVIAHEIGHIKYNHSNKKIAMQVGILFSACKLNPIYFITTLMISLFFNKHFERKADEFAYVDHEKGAGIIEFFELILKKEQIREDDFAAIKVLLKENHPKLSTRNYYGLLMRFHIAKMGHLFSKLNKFIYYNTLLGAHPSPEARIAAAKEYLAQQENTQQA